MLEKLDLLPTNSKVNCTKDLNRISTKDLLGYQVCGRCISNYVGNNYDISTKCLPRKMSMNKICPNNCNANGTCIFFDTNDNSILDSCELRSSQCDVRCNCNNGRTGHDCAKSFENLNRVQVAQEEILDFIATVAVADSRMQTTEV